MEKTCFDIAKDTMKSFNSADFYFDLYEPESKKIDF